MRFLRAFAAAAGASGSIIAAGGIVLALLSAGMAFHGWPRMRAPDNDVEATVLAQDQGRAVTRYAAARVAAVSTLPAVPVATAKPKLSSKAATRRHAKARRTPRTGR